MDAYILKQNLLIFETVLLKKTYIIILYLDIRLYI